MRINRTIFFLCLLPLIWSCKDQYISPYVSPHTGYLVVEGYISGNTSTQFTLSRTIALPGDSAIPAVKGATVQVEGNDNSMYPLNEIGNGVYSSGDTLQLKPAAQYRLRIKTNDEEYLSDLVAYKITPPIDSVNWTKDNDGSVEIYANTHDPSNNTRYYQWSWDDVYEYHSAEQTLIYYAPDTTPPMKYRTAAQQIYRCWTSGSSSGILVNTSAKLAQDEIYRQPLKSIGPNDIQLSVLYHILVRQYALTQDGYNFLSLMQKNTESLGSIFDAQPSELSGNIHCLTHPTERVIGYISAGSVTQQQLFISASQVGNAYRFGCPITDTVLPNKPVDNISNFSSGTFTPIDEFYAQGILLGFIANYTGCLNCLTRGGTTVAPPYWPN